MRKPIQFVIPAAGQGSRFSNAGFLEPKPLIPVSSIPMILWVIGNLPLEPGDSISIVTQVEHKLDATISNYLKGIDAHIRYVYLEELTDGAAITVRFAAKELNKQLPLVVINSDQYIPKGIFDFCEKLRSEPGDFGSILTMSASSNKWSYVGRDSAGEVNSIVEKIAISSEATVGVYGWSSSELFDASVEEMISANFRVNGEFYVAPSFNYLIARGCQIRTLNIGQVTDSVWGLGTPEDLREFLKNPHLETMKNSVLNSLKIYGL